MAKHRSVLSVETFRLEGTIFAPDVLQRLFKGELDAEYRFAVPPGTSLSDEYGRAFRIAVASWKQFQARRERNPQASQKQFLNSLFHEAFGYSLAPLADECVPFRLAGKGTIPIFYSWYDDKFDETAQRFSGDGLPRRKRSVTQYAQEWLNNRDDYLWAIVTNGRIIRLLRDNNSLTRPCWVEFDLERILSEERYSDFVFLWRLLYQDRAGELGSGDDSIWEKLRERGEEEGVRVFNDLRDGVIRALQILGNGFLRDTRNVELRDAIDSGKISEGEYFQELLMVAYRFLFLYTAEERKALLSAAPDSPADAETIYWAGYSLHRLVRRALRATAYDRHIDLWEGVKIVFNSLENGEKELALPALGGLFRRSECPHLAGCVLDNRTLLQATAALRWTQVNGQFQLVDYRNLGAEELGSVYESLLELVPTISHVEKTFGFIGITEEGLTAGNARKTSGSYYTHTSLVNQLVLTTIDPLIKKKLAGKVSKEDRELALLSITVLDPACGSGHFLLAAARRIAEALAQVRAGDTEAVTGELYRTALRDVVANCIYGTDLNPMALELAKIALWIETIVPGRPLGFLDSHFVCGNSILGISRLSQLDQGIQAEAFEPVGDDDPALVKSLKATNAAALKDLRKNPGQMALYTASDGSLETQRAAIDAMPTGTIAEIEAKAVAWNQFYSQSKTNRLYAAADFYTAAFLETKKDSALEYPDTAKLLALLSNDTTNMPSEETLRRCAKVCADAKVLHWPLVFPTVYAKGGFDCVLANPPWDSIELKKEEFFATRYPDIAQASTSAIRNQMIENLSLGSEAERKLYADFKNAEQGSMRNSAFIHGGKKAKSIVRYPLTGGDADNLYALFAELTLQLLKEDGRAGIVVPTGICTDDSTKRFFKCISEGGRIESLYDFENSLPLFPAVHRMYKFSLLTIGKSHSPDFAFYMAHPRDLQDRRRHFTLVAADLSLVNPNTLTSPICRSSFDAELMKKLYARIGVFINERNACNRDGDTWCREDGPLSQGLFNMSTCSSLFSRSGGESLLPLYEGKLIYQYDHRFASFKPGEKNAYELSELDKQDFAREVAPRYWVDRRQVLARVADVPSELCKAYKEVDFDGLRVSYANWCVASVSSVLPPDQVIEEYLGTTFLSSLPNDWYCAKFRCDCDNNLTGDELCGDCDIEWFDKLFLRRSPKWLVGYRSIVRAVDSRTTITSVLPLFGVGHSLSLLNFKVAAPLQACFVAEDNSLPHDWLSRQKLAGINMSTHYKKQMANLPPSAYSEDDVAFIVPRVLELTYTSLSLKEWAAALGYRGEPFVYDEDRRSVLKAELDVFFAKKYGLTEEEFRYILDPSDVMPPDEEGRPFPSESFRTLRDDEIARFGEYRTKRLALEAWARMSES